MIYYIYESSTGKILSFISSLSTIEPYTEEGQAYVETTELINITETYVSEGIILSFPNKPTTYHIWDWVSKIYIITTTEILIAKKDITEIINQTRNNLSLQPIAYDSKALDADAQAQSNINGKLQEIFAREAASTPLVSGEMFWKDADNVIHSWADQTAYKLWLQGLVIAISSRNTSLYATAWTKKAEVEALTDIDDIIAYDANAGW